ncbi:MAG: hypothetical protein EOO54_17870 [Haliea sp.]|nr:MAG: hypothetical protein EOO54_17870 [Haliea sp.]
MTPSGSPNPSATDQTPLHLLGQFDQPYTGAERELLDIRALLGEQRAVKLWSEVRPHAFYEGQGVATVQQLVGQFPDHGTLLIGGVHVRPGRWLAQACPGGWCAA